MTRPTGRPVGRPPTLGRGGGVSKVTVRLSRAQVRKLDAWARHWDCSRVEAVRRLIAAPRPRTT